MSWLAALAAAALASGGFTFDVARHPVDGGGLSNWPGQPATFPQGVTGIGDIIYAQPLHYRPLRLDLYRPPAGASAPLLVHVHGGAWVNGTKRMGGPVKDYPALLAQLAAKGYVVASVEYRLDGEAHFPAAIQDVKAAIRFLRQHAADYGIDPTRVGIFGESAGGQLAGLAATSCGVPAFEPPALPGAEGISTCVQAGAPWYGVYDFATVPTPPGNTGPAPYLGCPTPQCPAETMRFASPIAYVDRKDPPMLLIHGSADTLVAVSQTQEFEAKLRQSGVPVKAVYIPGVDHGLIGKDDAATGAAVQQGMTEMLGFFDRTFKP
ncbi:alpha/beta hydrolase [Novosphingobium rosa]|uniref:alpha/beta hydrolase n=1 Tax=Novosphingobium rosa TaxID=76978 RepID=UPI0008350CDE|nr:alpha/beta hydrolase [Novosphingobium rosa]